MDQGDELFDVVDEHDQVLRQCVRREVHAQSLMHRSVHILVFNPAGELYLQRRALTKDENPGYWDTSSAGHVNAGEDYLTSAHRELEEELGISAELHPFIKLKASSETYWEHVWAYHCITEQPIAPDPIEISEGRFWSLQEIEKAMERKDVLLTSTFQIIFREYKKKVL